MAKVVRLDSVLEEVGGKSWAFSASLSAAECLESGTYQIATATVDGAISLGPVTTGSILLMKSDQTVSYKLNTSATGIPLTANGLVLLFNTSVTSLTVSNASGSTANFEYAVWGA